MSWGWGGSGRNYGGICHTWAAQNKERGKNGNIFFEGPTIYSYGYHFPIATFVDERTVFFTTERYSVSTGQHIAAVSDALRGLNVNVFHTKYVLRSSGDQHDDNLADYDRWLDAKYLDAARSRKYTDMILESASNLLDERNRYATRFCTAYQLREAPDNLPELAKKAREESKRLAAERKEKEAQWAARQAAKLAEVIPKWRAGEYVLLPPHDTMLRLIDDGKTIETSRGARVPVDVAPWLWGMVSACRENTHALTDRSLSKYRVGDFELREISKEGDVTIGCHVIKYDELERMAKTLGYIKEAP